MAIMVVDVIAYIHSDFVPIALLPMTRMTQWILVINHQLRDSLLSPPIEFLSHMSHLQAHKKRIDRPFLNLLRKTYFVFVLESLSAPHGTRM